MTFTPQIILLHGLPGSGKSTLIRTLASTMPGSTAVCCGDLIRAEIAQSTPRGKDWQFAISRGDLISDEAVTAFMLDRLEHVPKTAPILLDGFPRTPPQADTLWARVQEWSGRPPVVLHIDTPVVLAKDRIRGRRTCTQCGAVFNTQSRPPKLPGVCDFDGVPLVARPDQDGMLLDRRMENYYAAYRSLLTFYRGKTTLMYELSGERSAEQLASDAMEMLMSSLPRRSNQSVSREGFYGAQ